MKAAAPITEFSQTSTVDQPAPEGRLATLLRLWSAFENTVVAVLAGISLLIVIYTIFTRFFIPTMTPSWADEVTVYVMVWATFLALSGVTASNSHVRADLLTHSMSPRSQAALEMLSHLCGAIFTAVLAWYGAAVARDAWEFNDLSTTTLRFPMWIYYAALPVGAGLMSIRYCILVYLGLTAAKSSQRQA